MRTFIAIDLTKDIKENIFEVVKELQRKLLTYLTSEEERSLTKWISKENLHLTLLFLGEVSKEKVEILKKLLSQAGKEFSSFELQTDKVILAPPNYKGVPRMIWITFKESSQLKSLRKILEVKLKDYFFFPKEEFIPHLTLVRFRTFYLKRFWPENFPQDLEKKFNLKFKVEEITLFESKLYPKGPEYIPLAKFKLNP